jgi:membrane-associated phospholipid phosphatase
MNDFIKGPLNKGLFFILTIAIIQTLSGKAFANSDFKSSFSAAFDTEMVEIWGAGVASVLIARSYDDVIRVNHGHHQIMSEKQADTGDFLGTGIPGLVIAGTQFFVDNTEGKKHFWSLFNTNLATYIGKYSFGRKRPGESPDHRSFPSGHTSTTFATATSLSYSYGLKAALPAYLAAVFTGASRIADDAHWFSDVVGGAFVGYIFARSAHVSLGVQSQSVVLPIYEKGLVGVSVVSHF